MLFTQRQCRERGIHLCDLHIKLSKPSASIGRQDPLTSKQLIEKRPLLLPARARAIYPFRMTEPMENGCDECQCTPKLDGAFSCMYLQ